MNILCHRGFWNLANEKNTVNALKNALERGYGFESDVRDFCGRLVISHDPAREDSPALEEVLKILAGTGCCFAINIKADGLVENLSVLLERYAIKNYFTFDMSIPQMLCYRAAGLKFFTRQSEFEPAPLLYADAEGIWLDSFESDEWITLELIEKHLNAGKKVCVVSPELHGRAPLEIWSTLRQLDGAGMYLCTDLPMQARKFFGGDSV